ncbi:MAG: uL15 family ribosomal protein, partial [Actinobacteria bacterium]|nr:uL15 family ribosomal protein [Actinomycetota bacterium]
GKKRRPVKVLGHGDLTKALTVRVDAVSATAHEKILAAGGSVVGVDAPSVGATESAGVDAQ